MIAKLAALLIYRNNDTHMPNQQPTYLKFDHDEYARTKAPDDFWGQIRRTVQGAKVSDDQIAMIVAAIRSGLDLHTEDTLLDIACGNGALSRLLFDSCSAYLGVDLSEHLISIAKANFEASPNFVFLQQGAAEYVRTEAPAGAVFQGDLLWKLLVFFHFGRHRGIAYASRQIHECHVVFSLATFLTRSALPSSIRGNPMWTNCRTADPR